MYQQLNQTRGLSFNSKASSQLVSRTQHNIQSIQINQVKPISTINLSLKNSLQQKYKVENQYKNFQCRAVSEETRIEDIEALNDTEMQNVLDKKGLVQKTPEGTQASIFAIFNEQKRIQYIGFSKDLSGSLLTCFTRRPDQTYYFKAVNLQKVDQSKMVQIRDSWYEEIGGAPPGNKLALERKQWQTNRVVETETISDKAELAQQLADKLYQQIRKAGCKEDIVANPKSLIDGQVEFVRKSSLSPELLQKVMEQIEFKKKATQVSKVVIDGEEQEFSVYYHNVFEANGGVMCDITSKYKNEECSQRIIVGKDYYEPYGIFPNQVVERVIGFMLLQKIPRKTEGILLMNQFPSNYFSVSDLHMWYPEFEDMFADLGIETLADGFWDLNRKSQWVAELEDQEGLNIALGRDKESLIQQGMLLDGYGQDKIDD